jgi:hypothetical protein
VTVPPLGAYWSRAKPRTPIDLPRMRRGATERFDNAGTTAKTAWKFLHHLISPDYEFLVDDPGIGDPPLAQIGQYIASTGSIEYAAMASQFLPVFQEGSVLEIGGGYGGLAWAVLKARDCDYTIVDLPEVGQCSEYYLGQFGERARVITPQQFSEERRGYDLVIQTRGFMEMDLSEVQWYFAAIQGWACPVGSLFFTLNRKAKETRFEDYPFDARWSVVLKGRWPESGRMPMLLLRREEEESRELAETVKELCK